MVSLGYVDAVMTARAAFDCHEIKGVNVDATRLGEIGAGTLSDRRPGPHFRRLISP